MTSKHYKKSRRRREKIITRKIHGDGNVIDSFIIDNGHKNGKELHSITDTGLILIYNLESGKLITKLIARPKQIERYYKEKNKDAPKWLIELAQWHCDMHYNK